MIAALILVIIALLVFLLVQTYKIQVREDVIFAALIDSVGGVIEVLPDDVDAGRAVFELEIRSYPDGNRRAFLR